MVEQVKSIDSMSQEAKYAGKVPLKILNEVIGILDVCIC
jgi:hypothetical protein